MTENRTWILLRGLGREKGHWGPFTDQFQARFPNDEVLPIDLPGTGEFRDLNSPLDMDGIFKFVRGQAVAKAKGTPAFHVVAMSLGAMVAMEWMRSAPKDLAGCVLINTSARDLSPMYLRLRWQVWRQFLQIATNQNMREREKALIELLINSDEGCQKALPVWTKLAVEHPVRSRNAVNQLWAASRFEGLTQASNVPVVLLNSLGDRFVDPSCSERLRQKWGWPMERHAWAGHDLTWDDPDWVLNKIEAWTKNVLPKVQGAS